MTLPDTVFFPFTVLPLRIFEPRYRQMLQDVLEADRLFAVAARVPDPGPGLDEDEPPCAIATLGVVRSCQTLEDGTSHLLLQGLSRIRIEAIVAEEPYRLIEVSLLRSTCSISQVALERLSEDLLRTIRRRAKLDPSVSLPIIEAVGDADASALCDLAAYSLSDDAPFKQGMLETLDTAERLRRTIAHLRGQIRALELQRRLQGRLADDAIADN